MASGDSSLPPNSSGSTSGEAPPDPQAPILPNLDDLSHSQAQRILEAALQHYRAAEMTPAASGGTTVTAAALLNGGLVASTASSGKRGELGDWVPSGPGATCMPARHRLAFACRPPNHSGCVALAARPTAGLPGLDFDPLPAA